MSRLATRISRHPWRCSLALALVLLLAGTSARALSTDLRRGGAYVESAVHSGASESTGSYLALLVSRSNPRSVSEFLAAGLGIAKLPPRPSDSYSPTERLAVTSQASLLGGASDIYRSADDAWVAAHRVAAIPLDGLSSVLEVDSVAPGSPFDLAGLAPGDRIRTVNGLPASWELWNSAVFHGFKVAASVAVGTEITLEWTPAGAPPSVLRTASSRVAPRVVSSSAWQGHGRLEGSIGVTVDEIVALRSPRPLLTVPEGVTGSSAGVVHALAYLDALTPGDLTGGMTVAATATVSPSGKLGEIGGIDVKSEAAEAAGADVLFVHPDDRAGVDPRFTGVIVEVRHLDEVVRWLCLNGGTSTSCLEVWVEGPTLGIPAGFEDLQAALDEKAFEYYETPRRTPGYR